MINELLIILASFAGIGFGYALTYIAPEEIGPGRKYFLLLERILLGACTLPILYFLVIHENYVLGLLALLIVGGLFFLPLYSRVSLFCLLYAVVIALLGLDIQTQIVQASLVFLYGLPAGTLLRKKIIVDI